MVDPAHAYALFREQLVGAGLLFASGVRGLYGRSGTFEHVIEQFERLVSRAGRHLDPEVMRFPPVMSRASYGCTGHIHNFPDLLGSVHSFTGDGRAHRAMVRRFEGRADDGGDWTEALSPTDMMLIPAACYPLYPTATGTLSVEGRTVDLRSYVFRHEPSDDPARMQIFRQREYVRLGTAEQALAHRDAWLERGQKLLRSLGLPVEAVVANDPFFGRGGRLAKATQREQDLKFELVVPICLEDSPTAVSSCNYHLDAFGIAFDITGPDGAPAHTACIGFGLERVALALFKHHGLDVGSWPKAVRKRLDL
jgi:seryl-tRNA synthetase